MKSPEQLTQRLADAGILKKLDTLTIYKNGEVWHWQRDRPVWEQLDTRVGCHLKPMVFSAWNPLYQGDELEHYRVACQEWALQ